MEIVVESEISQIIKWQLLLFVVCDGENQFSWRAVFVENQIWDEIKTM